MQGTWYIQKYMSVKLTKSEPIHFVQESIDVGICHIDLVNDGTDW